ncbi:MAG: 7-carboxy-7-deazaguanine synthase QueE [Pseudomonadota bacterium]
MTPAQPLRRAGSVTEPRPLRITEVFCSLQGEGLSVGRPTVFVRLTGCPLRCRYCDTAYAFTGGTVWQPDELMAAVAGYGVAHVTVTGGEPLAQPGCSALVEHLCDAGYRVSVETSGALDIGGIDRRASRVVDFKTPSSGEFGRNHWENVAHLGENDQVKFVVGDRADYEWARDWMLEQGLPGRCEVLFSPVHETLAPRTLADWMVADRLPARFQIQLHKLLWGEEPGR